MSFSPYLAELNNFIPFKNWKLLEIRRIHHFRKNKLENDTMKFFNFENGNSWFY